jgi:hypothetical protein
MRLGHEFLEMQPPLRRERHLFEKQIKQQRLAAADAAVKIESGWGVATLRRKGPRSFPSLGTLCCESRIARSCNFSAASAWAGSACSSPDLTSAR